MRFTIITSISADFILIKDLYERQHFILDDCWRVIFGGDDSDQHAFHEVPVSHLDVKPVATVFHARFQNLQREGVG